MGAAQGQTLSFASASNTQSGQPNITQGAAPDALLAFASAALSQCGQTVFIQAGASTPQLFTLSGAASTTYGAAHWKRGTIQVATNGLYHKARQALLEGQFNLLTATVKVQLLSLGYQPDYAQHQWLSDVPANARKVAPVTLTSKTTTDGVFSAAAVTFPDVTPAQLHPTGGGTGYIGGLLLYIDNGTAASSPLIACLQALHYGTGQSVQSTIDASLDWSQSLNGVFRL